jgi:hypothetical protein
MRYAAGALLLALLFPRLIGDGQAVRAGIVPDLRMQTAGAAAPLPLTGPADRAYSVQVLMRIAEPVLDALSRGELKERLPVHDWEKHRAAWTHYEAFARTLAGIAPWLELGPDDTPEGRLRVRFIALAHQSLINATDPASPDFLNFGTVPNQPLVESAYLAYALLSAPRQLWEPLTRVQRANVLNALRTSRGIRQVYNNNWVLFPAMIEAALWQFDDNGDRKRIETAVTKFNGWYLGDGVYGDGPALHWDYYNSYVIHPMLLAVLRVAEARKDPLARRLPVARERARRYAEILERYISPQDTFPVMGRSSTYRFAAFYHLADMALHRELPDSLDPGAVRAGITAVVRRMVEAPGTFDDRGWLNLGAVGAQPGLREDYNATGSLYVCLTGLVHLGLPADDPFWTAPSAAWTQLRVWSGEDVPRDRFLPRKPREDEEARTPAPAVERAPAPAQAPAIPAIEPATGADDRAYSVQVATRIAEPVLDALSKGELKKRLPIHEWEKDRAAWTHYEAFARTLAGLAPWLELGPDNTEEGRVRTRFIGLARQSVINATDPGSPDFLNFGTVPNQPLVETAYFAYALLRAPRQLWEPLDAQQRKNVLDALRVSRAIEPRFQNNWVLFPAMREAALWQLDAKHRIEPIESGVKTIESWYLGDGTYGDGPSFHWDYYNSYAIHPMLLEVLRVAEAKQHPLARRLPLARERAGRYAEILERLISPEGTFPVMGRSSAYRFAAFYHLANMALSKELPESLNPGAVRAALTTVVRRMNEAPGTFDENGWLKLGVVGSQPGVREDYNATGSLYMCLTGLVHLGLPADDPFWTMPSARWTQQRIWAGDDVPRDHALQPRGQTSAR